MTDEHVRMWVENPNIINDPCGGSSSRIYLCCAENVWLYLEDELQTASLWMAGQQ